MKDTKTFNEYLVEQQLTETDMQLLKESLQEEWTPELEAKVDYALEQFVQQFQNEDGSFDLDRLEEGIVNEGLLGSIIGGLTGFALGKSVGKMIAKVLERDDYYNDWLMVKVSKKNLRFLSETEQSYLSNKDEKN